MTRAFPEALVVGYEPLVSAMTNDRKDRHVAAAAVKSGAQVIVTNNLKDFQSLPEGVEAQSADEFLMNLFDLGPDDMSELVRAQAGALKNPPRSLDELLAGLGKMVPEFSMAIRQRVHEEDKR